MKMAPVSVYPDRELRLWLETLSTKSERPMSKTVVRILRREKMRQERKRWPAKPAAA